MLTMGSLFSGIGGFDLGFAQAGIATAWQVEKEPFCQAVLRTRFSGVELLSDVKECGKHNLAPVDIITAGFPCQGLSVAGKRGGLADDRSGLFWEAHRIVGELRPAWFVIENVPGFFSSWCSEEEGNGERWQCNDFDTAVRALHGLGYGLTWRVADSRYWNVAQRRERVFLVGHSSGVCPGSVLLDGACMPGDFAQGEEAGEDIAVPLTHGSGVSGNAPGRRREDNYNLVSYALSGNERLDGPVETFIANSLRASDSHHGHSSPRGDGCDNLVAAPLQSHSKRHGHAMTTQQAAESGHIVAATLNSGGNNGGFSPEPAEHLVATFDWNKSPKQQMRVDGHTTGPIRSANNGMPAVAHPITASYGKQVDSSNRNGGPPNIVAFQESQSGCREYKDAGTLRANGPGHDPVGTRIRQGMTVRRLSPVECERLQNFPDGWTIPDHKFWKYKDDPEWPLLPKGLDSARYRALGNAVTVSVARWIGERIKGVADGEQLSEDAG